MYKSQQFPQIKHIHLSLSHMLKKLSSSSTQYVAVSKLNKHKIMMYQSQEFTQIKHIHPSLSHVLKKLSSSCKQ